MAEMRAERQAAEAQFQIEIQEIRAFIQHNQERIRQNEDRGDELEVAIQECRRDMQAGFAELREAQAMMMEQFRERDGRLIEAQLSFIREMREMQREVAELRLDFLNHMCQYHPPVER
ncbi:hypothetical protein [Synechococcus sp. W55.1]|uniref:hypothetical protein n=1 Tax=Synechococcus sp. W55.1 TaxID=2964512 RepID=UPI0039C061F4